MKRPTKIKILNLDYTVQWEKGEWHEETGNYGTQDLRRQTIRVDKEATPQAQADTFLHEIVHAIFDAMGLAEKDMPEEPVARRLATGLCTVWKDNPKAFRWWQSSL